MDKLENRRPLKSRGSAWARALARALAKANVQPDAISALSVAFAVLGAASFLVSGNAHGWMRSGELLAAALCIQGRLICNLLDGMVAVEYGRGSSAGPIWNELPDRFADVFFLAGAGYAAERSGMNGAAAVGWIAAALAVTTAYVRELGRGLGQPADFSGPMAKPHRMAALTVAAVLAAFEPFWKWHGQTLAIAVGVIAVGALITVFRRTATLARRLSDQLEDQSEAKLAHPPAPPPNASKPDGSETT